MSSPSTTGGVAGSRLRCRVRAARWVSCSVRSESLVPMLSASSESRTMSARRKSRVPKTPTCRTPRRPCGPSTGTPRSRWTPASRRTGLSTETSLTSLTTTGACWAATRPAKPAPTRTWVAPRHLRPSPAEAAGSRTVPDLSSRRSVAVSEPISSRTESIIRWTDTWCAVNGQVPPSLGQDRLLQPRSSSLHGPGLPWCRVTR